MARGRITLSSVKALVCPKGKDRGPILWDTELIGFGVYPLASGQVTYCVQARPFPRRKIEGRWAPAEARREAKRMLGDIAKGIDPSAERRKARAVRTFREVAEDFMRQHVAAKRKGRTAQNYREALEKHVFPAIKSRRVADVRRADMVAIHDAMKETPSSANLVLAIVSSMWTWAERRGEVGASSNPVKGIERYPEQGRERYLTSAELARLGDALRQGETVGLPYAIDESGPKAKHAPKEANRRVILDPFAIAAIRLLILTGARLREILHAKWSEVDFERGVIFLADSKTGRKPIYLSAGTLEVLAGLPRLEGNPHIIPGEKAGQPKADLKKPWGAVRKAAGLDGVRLHDLRHSFASIGAGASMGLPVIGKLLGHSQPQTTARYAHLDADPLRRAVDTIGATISAAMNRNEGAEVVPLRKI